MNELVLIFGLHSGQDYLTLIPIFGMLTGIIIPLSVFLWLYHDAKNKRATVLEISKNIQDKEKVDELLKIFEQNPSWNEEAAKKKLLEFFDLLGFNDPNVVEARKKLSSMMFK